MALLSSRRHQPCAITHYRPPACQPFASAPAARQMWYRPRDEAAVFLYGSSTTCNFVHDEMAAAGEEGQYEGIMELHP